MTTTPSQPPPQVAMLQLLIGYWVSKMIHLVTRLGIPDLLKEGPRTAEDLARSAGVEPNALYRILRALAGSGLFSENDKRFELTPLGATLQKGVPGSMHAFALMMPESYNWKAWDDLLYGVKTGKSPFEHIYGVNGFDFFEKNPEFGKEFGEAMSSLCEMENPAVASAKVFDSVSTLMDIGGGHGSLLSAVLRANPKIRGILYDLESVTGRAKGDIHITGSQVAGRIDVKSGSFFESVPEGADGIIMKYILHDWSDEQCVQILRNCHRALPPDGLVFVVDNVIPPGNNPHWGKLLDVNMLVLTSGRERTEEEFRSIFEEAGFRLTRVTKTDCPLSVVEGVKIS